MEEIAVETIVRHARESFPGATPRIITDNGPQCPGVPPPTCRRA
jgi:hypothetical protein